MQINDKIRAKSNQSFVFVFVCGLYVVCVYVIPMDT